jgi:hypothetical protein
MLPHLRRGGAADSDPKRTSTARRRPSQSIIDIDKPLGSSVHDHIIVGKEGSASFKGLKRVLKLLMSPQLTFPRFDHI